MTRENKTERTPDERQKFHRQPSLQPHIKATEHPTLTLVVLGFITCFFLVPLLTNGLELTADRDEYIPADNENPFTVDYLKVRENWPDESYILYIEVEDPDQYPLNITNGDFLRAMWEIELHLNYDPVDDGLQDYIPHTLSLASLVAETNHSLTRLSDAVVEETRFFLEFYGAKDVSASDIENKTTLNAFGGNRSIPNEQDKIDAIVGTIPENLLEDLVTDTNDDGIWDTAVIVVALREDKDPRWDDLPGSHEETLDKIEDLTKDWEASQQGKAKLTITGEPVLERFTEEETMSAMEEILLVMAVLTVLGVMLFYRSFKAVMTIALPTFSTLVWIFGFAALTGIIVTPLTLLAIPVLLIISLMFNIQLADRMALKWWWTKGEDKEQVKRFFGPNGGEENPVTRAKKALDTAGKTVMTGAIVAMIALASLCFGTIAPLTSLGVLLVIGVFFAQIHAFFMVPALAILQDYHRMADTEEHMGNQMARLPEKKSKSIITAALVIFMISVTILPAVEMGTSRYVAIPSDPSLEGFSVVRAHVDYSQELDSGSNAFVLVEPRAGQEFESRDYDYDSRNPVLLLEELEIVQTRIQGIPEERFDLDLRTLSIVDIMKETRLEGEIKLKELWDEEVGTSFPFGAGVEVLDLSGGGDAWSTLRSATLGENTPVQKLYLNIFYRSILYWMKSMFMPGELDDVEGSIIMVEGPVFNSRERYDIVLKVNEITKEEYVLTESSSLVGPLALEERLDELAIESLRVTLTLSIILMFLTLSFIYKDKNSPWNRPNFKMGMLTTLPVVLVIGMIPLVMLMAAVSLNIYSVMTTTLAPALGIVFSVFIMDRIRDQGMNIGSVRKALVENGQAGITMLMVPVLALCAFFLIPISAFYNFVLVVMIIHVCFGLGALLFLPATVVFLIQRHESREPPLQQQETIPAPKQPPTYSGKVPSGTFGKMKHYLWDVPDDYHPAARPAEPEHQEVGAESGQEIEEEPSPESELEQKPEFKESSSSSFSILAPEQQTGIPKAEKPVLSFLSPLVGPEHSLPSGKGGNQHEKGGSREMEVGEKETGGGTEAVARKDEDTGGS